MVIVIVSMFVISVNRIRSLIRIILLEGLVEDFIGGLKMIMGVVCGFIFVVEVGNVLC